MNRILWNITLVLAGAGIVVTLLLTWAHFNGSVQQICSPQSGCGTVLASSYSEFLQLPTALFGFMYYFFVFVVIGSYPLLETGSRSTVINVLLSLSFVAFALSIVLTIYSIIVLGTTCIYCLISTGIATCLFLVLIFWWIRGQRLEKFENISSAGLKIAVGLLVVTTAIFAGLYFQTWLHTPVPESNANGGFEKSLLAYEANSIGNPQAPIRVVEFFDLACPHCQRFTARIFPKIKRNYIDKGKVLWTFRAFPVTRMHKHSLYAHSVLSLVPDNQYVSAKKQIMSDADRWNSRNNQSPKSYFDFFMREYGLSGFGEPPRSIGNEIMQRRKFYMRTVGVKATPSFVVNGKLLQGAQSYREFKRLFDRIIRRKGEQQTGSSVK